MEIKEHVGEIINLLETQTVHINALAECEKQLQKSVVEKDWNTLQGILAHMEVVSEKITTIEEKRKQKFSTMGTGSFSRFFELLPHDYQERFSHEYRKLQIAVLRLQGITASMDTYLRSAIVSTQTILREIYPESCSSEYSENGKGEVAAAPAFLVNQQG